MQEHAECLVISFLYLKGCPPASWMQQLFPALYLVSLPEGLKTKPLFTFPLPQLSCLPLSHHALRCNINQVNTHQAHWSTQATFIKHIGKLTPLCSSFYSFHVLSTLFVFPFVHRLLSLCSLYLSVTNDWQQPIPHSNFCSSTSPAYFLLTLVIS